MNGSNGHPLQMSIGKYAGNVKMMNHAVALNAQTHVVDHFCPATGLVMRQDMTTNGKPASQTVSALHSTASHRFTSTIQGPPSMTIRRKALLQPSALSLSAACLARGASGANAQNQGAMQKMMKSTVMLAANNARIASEVCGVDASTVSNHNNSASRKFGRDSNFTADWDMAGRMLQKPSLGFSR